MMVVLDEVAIAPKSSRFMRGTFTQFIDVASNPQRIRKMLVASAIGSTAGHYYAHAFGSDAERPLEWAAD